MIGRTLSHYQVTAALGAGGMGEVYRATDTALGRDNAGHYPPLLVGDRGLKAARIASAIVRVQLFGRVSPTDRQPSRAQPPEEGGSASGTRVPTRRSALLWPRGTTPRSGRGFR